MSETLYSKEEILELLFDISAELEEIKFNKTNISTINNTNSISLKIKIFGDFRKKLSIINVNMRDNKTKQLINSLLVKLKEDYIKIFSHNKINIDNQSINNNEILSKINKSLNIIDEIVKHLSLIDFEPHISTNTNSLHIPWLTILKFITLFNIALISGGTIFGAFKVSSILENYDKSIQLIEVSEAKYKQANSKLENITKVINNLNDKIKITLEEQTIEVLKQKQQAIISIKETDKLFQEEVIIKNKNIKNYFTILLNDINTTTTKLVDINNEINTTKQTYQSFINEEKNHLKSIKDYNKQIASEIVRLKSENILSIYDVIKYSDNKILFMLFGTILLLSIIITLSINYITKHWKKNE